MRERCAIWTDAEYDSLIVLLEEVRDEGTLKSEALLLAGDGCGTNSDCLVCGTLMVDLVYDQG